MKKMSTQPLKIINVTKNTTKGHILLGLNATVLIYATVLIHCAEHDYLKIN